MKRTVQLQSKACLDLTRAHVPVALSQDFTRYKLGVSYYGPHFSGWVAGPDSGTNPSVHDTLYKAIEAAVGLNNFENLKGSSRTDAGVHAICNSCQVDVIQKPSAKMDASKLMMAINFHLNAVKRDRLLAVNLVEQMAPTFDARQDALARTYVYKIIHPISQRRASYSSNIFRFEHALISKQHLDVDAMNAACKLLLGEQDFRSFQKADCQSKTAYRFLQQFEVVPQKNSFAQYNANTPVDLTCLDFLTAVSWTHIEVILSNINISFKTNSHRTCSISKALRHFMCM